MPWPVKSTLMVSREREPVTDSTRTSQRLGLRLAEIRDLLSSATPERARTALVEGMELARRLAPGGLRQHADRRTRDRRTAAAGTGNHAV